MDTESDARVIRPGEAEHPGEQVRRTGWPAPSGLAVYHVRLTIPAADRSAAPSIASVEQSIAALYPGAKAEATRTDI